MKNLYIFPALLLLPFSGFPQAVFVVDKSTNVPIEAVMVFTEDQKHYLIYSSGIPAPGINFIFSLHAHS